MDLDAAACCQQLAGDQVDDWRGQNGRRTQSEGNDQPPDQQILDFHLIIAAMCLRHQSGGTHSKKAKPEIEKAEHQRTKSDTTNIGRVRKASHHCRVDSTNKWHRDIGQKDRPGN